MIAALNRTEPPVNWRLSFEVAQNVSVFGVRPLTHVSGGTYCVEAPGGYKFYLLDQEPTKAGKGRLQNPTAG